LSRENPFHAEREKHIKPGKGNVIHGVQFSGRFSRDVGTARGDYGILFLHGHETQTGSRPAEEKAKKEICYSMENK
jgi:hypothetical protein